MSGKHVILSIDDNEMNQDLLKLSLTSFDMHLAFNGWEGIEKARALKPAVILLDISMPGMNGFEVCTALKADKTTSDIPIVFISALNTHEDKIKSYNAGGEDFIAKPVNIAELKHKLDVLLAYQKHFTELSSRLSSASTVAMTAMTHSSEMGVIIDYVAKSISCKSFDALSQHVFEVFDAYGIHGSMSIRDYDTSNRYYSNTLLSPLETQLLDMAKYGARIACLGKRALFNSQLVSLLVKDMPDDEDRCGRLKDRLSIVLSCAEACITTLLNDEDTRRFRSTTANQLLVDANATVNLVLTKIKQYQDATKNIVSQMSLQIDNELISLMLSEEVENRLQRLVASAQNKLDQTLDIGEELDGMLANLSNTLTQLAN